MFSSAGKLTLFISISIVLLLGIRALTAPAIAEAERESLIQTFSEVLPEKNYNNDPLHDTIIIKDKHYLELLGSAKPVTIYRAFKNEEPAGAILTAIAPNGYSGNITLLVGVLPDGRISGVRVLNHRETPGLGDKIEIAKTNWVLEFDGRKLRDNNEPRWAVKKDGGDFDQFTGATITPRAVIDAVKNALIVINDLGAHLYE